MNKEFSIWTSERCYRFKEDAFQNHAPQTPGIYELVTFDERQQPKVLYAGLTTDKSIFQALYEHFEGSRQPAAKDLLAKHPNLYFSYVVDSDAKTPEDMQDLFYGIVHTDQAENPDPATVKHTGRYSEIKVKDKSIL